MAIKATGDIVPQPGSLSTEGSRDRRVRLDGKKKPAGSEKGAQKPSNLAASVNPQQGELAVAAEASLWPEGGRDHERAEDGLGPIAWALQEHAVRSASSMQLAILDDAASSQPKALPLQLYQAAVRAALESWQDPGSSLEQRLQLAAWWHDWAVHYGQIAPAEQQTALSHALRANSKLLQELRDRLEGLDSGSDAAALRADEFLEDSAFQEWRDGERRSLQRLVERVQQSLPAFNALLQVEVVSGEAFRRKKGGKVARVLKAVMGPQNQAQAHPYCIAKLKFNVADGRRGRQEQATHVLPSTAGPVFRWQHRLSPMLVRQPMAVLSLQVRDHDMQSSWAEAEADDTAHQTRPPPPPPLAEGSGTKLSWVSRARRNAGDELLGKAYVELAGLLAAGEAHSCVTLRVPLQKPSAPAAAVQLPITQQACGLGWQGDLQLPLPPADSGSASDSQSAHSEASAKPSPERRRRRAPWHRRSGAPDASKAPRTYGSVTLRVTYTVEAREGAGVPEPKAAKPPTAPSSSTASSANGSLDSEHSSDVRASQQQGVDEAGADSDCSSDDEAEMESLRPTLSMRPGEAPAPAAAPFPAGLQPGRLGAGELHVLLDRLMRFCFSSWQLWQQQQQRQAAWGGQMSPVLKAPLPPEPPALPKLRGRDAPRRSPAHSLPDVDGLPWPPGLLSSAALPPREVLRLLGAFSRQHRIRPAAQHLLLLLAMLRTFAAGASGSCPLCACGLQPLRSFRRLVQALAAEYCAGRMTYEEVHLYTGLNARIAAEALKVLDSYSTALAYCEEPDQTLDEVLKLLALALRWQDDLGSLQELLKPHLCRAVDRRMRPLMQACQDRAGSDPDEGLAALQQLLDAFHADLQLDTALQAVFPPELDVVATAAARRLAMLRAAVQHVFAAEHGQLWYGSALQEAERTLERINAMLLSLPGFVLAESRSSHPAAPLPAKAGYAAVEVLDVDRLVLRAVEAAITQSQGLLERWARNALQDGGAGRGGSIITTPASATALYSPAVVDFFRLLNEVLLGKARQCLHGSQQRRQYTGTLLLDAMKRSLRLFASAIELFFLSQLHLPEYSAKLSLVAPSAKSSASWRGDGDLQSASGGPAAWLPGLARPSVQSAAGEVANEAAAAGEQLLMTPELCVCLNSLQEMESSAWTLMEQLSSMVLEGQEGRLPQKAGEGDWESAAWRAPELETRRWLRRTVENAEGSLRHVLYRSFLSNLVVVLAELQEGAPCAPGEVSASSTSNSSSTAAGLFRSSGEPAAGEGAAAAPEHLSPFRRVDRDYLAAVEQLPALQRLFTSLDRELGVLKAWTMPQAFPQALQTAWRAMLLAMEELVLGRHHAAPSLRSRERDALHRILELLRTYFHAEGEGLSMAFLDGSRKRLVELLYNADAPAPLLVDYFDALWQNTAGASGSGAEAADSLGADAAGDADADGAGANGMSMLDILYLLQQRSGNAAAQQALQKKLLPAALSRPLQAVFGLPADDVLTAQATCIASHVGQLPIGRQQVDSAGTFYITTRHLAFTSLSAHAASFPQASTSTITLLLPLSRVVRMDRSEAGGGALSIATFDNALYVFRGFRDGMRDRLESLIRIQVMGSQSVLDRYLRGVDAAWVDGLGAGQLGLPAGQEIVRSYACHKLRTSVVTKQQPGTLYVCGSMVVFLFLPDSMAAPCRRRVILYTDIQDVCWTAGGSSGAQPMAWFSRQIACGVPPMEVSRRKTGSARTPLQPLEADVASEPSSLTITYASRSSPAETLRLGGLTAAEAAEIVAEVGARVKTSLAAAR